MDAEKPQPRYESPLDLAISPATQLQTSHKETSQTKTQLLTHWPSDEQPQLASQAENMASLLKSDSTDSAISERLQKFAINVGMLEERTSKYQAIIQRQQVQIQHLSEASSPHLIAQLREELSVVKHENEALQSVISSNVQRQQLQPAIQIEEMDPGRGMENGAETKSMLLYPDSPLMKRIDELQHTNAKLFKANKDWHSKWEQLRQSKQNEKEELVSRLKKLEDDNERLKSELASSQNKAKEEKEKEGKLRHKEKDAQIALQREQLTVFMQDFEKEKKEKKGYQDNLKKKEKECEKLKVEHEQKLKSLSAEVKLKEEKIKDDKKEMLRLQYRIAELVTEVREEKRRADTAAAAASAAGRGGARLPTQSYGVAHQVSSSPTDITSLVYPSSAGAPLSTLYSSQFAIGHRRGPEELPGAWPCPDCTYLNYPDRTVCDMCGLTKSFDGPISFSDVGTHAELQSRGSSPSRGRNVPDAFADVEVDSAY